MTRRAMWLTAAEFHLLRNTFGLAAREFQHVVKTTLGAAPASIEPGRLHRFATRDKRGDDAGFCRLFEDMRAGIYGCHRQFPGETFKWFSGGPAPGNPTDRTAVSRLRERQADQRATVQRLRWQRNGGRMAQLWAHSVPVTAGDPVARYLERRLGSRLAKVPDCLRLHPALPYWLDGELAGTWPAMMAQLSAPDGRIVGLHRTWLTREGRKAPTPGPVKKLAPTAGPLAGACIRLDWPTAGGTLGIAEGIETALAARCAAGVPTVAAYSAGALAAWRWPVGVRRLLVFADADRAGAAAADTLRARAVGSGLSVHVLMPTTPGMDWCDVWTDGQGLAEVGQQ